MGGKPSVFFILNRESTFMSFESLNIGRISHPGIIFQSELYGIAKSGIVCHQFSPLMGPLLSHERRHGGVLIFLTEFRIQPSPNPSL